MQQDDPNALVTLAQARSEFEANMMVSVLANAGIEAHAFGAVQGALPLNARFLRVPVQVRARELEAAQQALAQNVSDSIDLNWDEVDVGEREDSLPLREPGTMPVAAKVAIALVATLLALGLLAVLASSFN